MQRFKNLPNIITMIRLFLVPAIVAMITGGRWVEAFVVFLLAGLSDALDGWLAKRFSLQTELGAYLALAITGAVPAWLTILVVSRDIMIIGAILISWVLDKPVRVAPLFVSKVNTAVQLVFATWVLAERAFGWPSDGILSSLAVATVAALTLASAAAYLGPWIKHMGR